MIPFDIKIKGRGEEEKKAYIACRRLLRANKREINLIVDKATGDLLVYGVCVIRDGKSITRDFLNNAAEEKC